MTRPQIPAIGLKVETAMGYAEISADLVCPLGTPSFQPGTHDYDPKRNDPIEGLSTCMTSRQEVPKGTRIGGQRWSSTAILRMVKQPAINCPKDCQTTAPSLQLRLQPSLWH